MDVSACRSQTDPPHLGGYIEGGDPDTWYPALWDWAYDQLGVRTVLDVGCGEGHTVRYFTSLGCEAFGIDGSAKAMRDSVAPSQQIVHDFTAGPFDPRRTFDLVWSCEFVEHIDEEYSTHFLRTFQHS